MVRTRIYAFAAAAVLASLLGVTYWLTLRSGSQDLYAACRTSSVASGAGSIGGPFTLQSETGATVSEAEVLSKPSLVYFGYTFCPDVCPMDTARNAETVEILQAEGYDVQPVFISVDPDRDTPEVMAEFTDYLHPDMLGLTGNQDQIKAAAQAYKAYYRKQDGDDDYYLVDHSTFTYLMLPEIGFVEFFRRDLPANNMAQRTMCFIDAGS